MTNPLIGAIRWDGWYSSNLQSIAACSAAAQSYSDLVNYIPVHWSQSNAKAIPHDVTQSVIDAEIIAAHRLGVDYFAWLIYGTIPGDPTYNSELRAAWNLYHSSSVISNVKWAAMIQPASCGSWLTSTIGDQLFSSQIAVIVSYFQQTSYQYVTISGTSRPILYIFWVTSDLAKWNNSLSNFGAFITALRVACTSASVQNPYIVIMNWGDATVATGVGADAISSYAPPVTLTQNMTYSDYCTAISGSPSSSLTHTPGSGFWDTCKTRAGASLSVVPNASAGWTSIGRTRRPETWSLKTTRPRVGSLATVTRPTATELKNHINQANSFIAANQVCCPANTMVLYAWNEWMEGNGIGPTFANPTGQSLI